MPTGYPGSGHQVSEYDPATRTGVCQVCGPTTVWRTGGRLACATMHSVYVQRSEANRVARGRGPRERRLHRRHLADRCARCGFLPEVKGQLDVHHLDSDHKNNDPSNLITLCANCHRYVEAPGSITVFPDGRAFAAPSRPLDPAIARSFGRIDRYCRRHGGQATLRFMEIRNLLMIPTTSVQRHLVRLQELALLEVEHEPRGPYTIRVIA